jgi:hypothetical protein
MLDAAPDILSGRNMQCNRQEVRCSVGDFHSGISDVFTGLLVGGIWAEGDWISNVTL